MEELDKFISSMDSDIAWRKQEVSKILLMHSEEHSELIVKSSMLLIYSHWEGCVRTLCKLYLGYVSDLSICLPKLTDNYKAIELKGRINRMFNSSESLTMSDELSFIKSIDYDKFKVSDRFKEFDQAKSIIDTKDNLRYEIFESFLDVVGIGEKSCLKTKRIYIDKKMLQNRNQIAHGNKFDKFKNEFALDIESIKVIKNLVFSIIDSLADDLKHYAENEYYLSSKEVETGEYDKRSNISLESVLADIAL